MNEQALPIFEQILWPFRDLGVVAVRHGNTDGTDHLAFDGAGIPGFNFIQDPIEYGIRTHHTYVDTFDGLVLEDLQQAAVVVAATVYQLAMRDEMVPRKEPRSATNLYETIGGGRTLSDRRRSCSKRLFTVRLGRWIRPTVTLHVGPTPVGGSCFRGRCG
jgi:hypothetical protein